MDSRALDFSLNSSTWTENGGVLQFYECRPVTLVFFVSEMFNTVLGLFTNIWVQVLILRDGRNQAMQEIFIVNLGMLEILYCFLSQVLILNYVVLKITFINNCTWFVYGLGFFGRALFQCGMSMERYVAVVHPMFFYRHHFLKCKVIFLIAGWLMTVICVWSITQKPVISLVLGVFIFIASVNLFCSLSILRVLRRPSPGAGAGAGAGKKLKEMNLKKRRACYTVMIIQATAIFNCVPHFIAPALQLHMTPYTFTCVYQPLGFSCCLMGSFLQPLMFLHRAGKLQRPGHKESP